MKRSGWTNKSWLKIAGLIVAAPAMLVGCAGGFVDVGGVIGDTASDFLNTGRTLSFFQAVQVDPRSEDSAGPQFVVAADLNADGNMDLVSAWNQSQPVQIHLQERTAGGGIRFVTTILAGNTPVVSVAGLTVADFDQDGAMDIAVLVKDSLVAGPLCLDAQAPAEGLSGVIVVYFGPSDSDQADQALAWNEVPIGTSFIQGAGESTGRAEEGGFTSLSTGDMDGDTDLDLVVAWNSDCGDGGSADAVIFTNQGPGASRDGTWTAVRIPDSVPKGGPIKSIALGDFDQDGDLDVVATFPLAQTMNVRWYRNPVSDTPDDYHVSDGQWQVGLVGQIATGADVVRTGDLDQDGLLDVVVRSSNGKVIQWLRGPEGATTLPLRALPWQVYTLAEYLERTPEGIALGDINNDGQLEVVASAEGGISWFNSEAANSVYDQWVENLIIDDQPSDDGSTDPATTDPNVTPDEVGESTSMNSVLIVDLDDDGENDIITTLDRTGLSGLTNDALVWFRSLR